MRSPWPGPGGIPRHPACCQDSDLGMILNCVLFPALSFVKTKRTKEKRNQGAKQIGQSPQRVRGALGSQLMWVFTLSPLPSERGYSCVGRKDKPFIPWSDVLGALPVKIRQDPQVAGTGGGPPVLIWASVSPPGEVLMVIPSQGASEGQGLLEGERSETAASGALGEVSPVFYLHCED